MNTMFDNANPGLSRKRVFRFDNYTVPQLDQIMDLKMSQQGLACIPEARKVAQDSFERALMRPNFENASEVESCLAGVKLNFENQQFTQFSETDVRNEVLETYDFDKDLDRNKLDYYSLLTGKVQASIVDKFAAHQIHSHTTKQRGLNPRDFVPTSFIFKEYPGREDDDCKAHGQFF